MLYIPLAEHALAVEPLLFAQAVLALQEPLAGCSSETVPGWVGTVPGPDPKTLRAVMAWSLFIWCWKSVSKHWKLAGCGCFVVFFVCFCFVFFLHATHSFNPRWNEEWIHFCCLYAPGKSVCEKRRLESSGVHCMGLAGRQMGTFFILLVVYRVSKGSRFVRVSIFSWKFIWKWTHPSGETSAVVHLAAAAPWSGGTEQVRRVSSWRAITFASALALTKFTVSLL